MMIDRGVSEGFPGLGEPERETNVSDLWSIVSKSRLLITFCAVAGLITGLAVAMFSEAQYKAVVSLNVERDAGRLFEVTENSQGVVYDPGFLPTQTRLMKSREVAERVVARLGLLGNPEISPSRSGLFRVAGPSTTETASSDLARAATRIQAGITATPITGTNLVELSYVGKSPKVTADVANALAEAYIDWSLESKFQVVGQASKFLSTQIEQIKSDIDQKEGELHSYGLQKDIISVDPRTNITLQKLESLNRDYAAAVSDRVGKEAHYYEVQSSPSDAIAASTNNQTVGNLRAELNRLQRTYNEKLQFYKADWPAMKELRSQIDQIQKALTTAVGQAGASARDEARRAYLTAQRREQSLHDELGTQKQEAMQLNSNAVEFNNLRNEVETKRNLLETLQKRQAETEVTARLRGQRVSTIRIVDRALIPTKPFSPSYINDTWNGLAFGALLGLVLAFLRDYMDRSLRSVEEVERYLRLPALGVVPALGAAHPANRAWYGYGSRLKKGKGEEGAEVPKIELIPHFHPRSAIAEAYRGARASLLLSQAGGVKSLVITSCLPAEGKTSTALNLAVVLAQLEKRVLLVDADLHKPRIHEAMRVSNRIGLVSILVENVPPSRAILQSPIPGLSVVLSGPMSPNPSGLLSSTAMRKFLEFAAMNYDYVLIDSPPVESVADALILGSQTDGIVLCIEAGGTPRDRVLRLRNRLLHSNVNIVGVLINKFREDTTRYGKYYAYERAAYGTAQPAATKSA